MGKKKRPLEKSQRLAGIIPWSHRRDGSAYIEIEPGVIITPHTDIKKYDEAISKILTGDKPEVSLTSEGLVFTVTVTDPQVLRRITGPSPTYSSSYTVSDSSD